MDDIGGATVGHRGESVPTGPVQNAGAPSVGGDAGALIALGLTARREGRDGLAADYFERAVAIEPGNAEYLVYLAGACFAAGRLDRTIEVYREAIRLKPGVATVHNDLGVVLARRGRHDEAAERYREAIRLDPKFPDAHNNLGNAVRLRGRLDEAIACYREALQLRPAYPEAHNNLGIALRHKGKTAEAVASYREALRLRPAYPEAHHNLGIALGSQGRHEAAIASFEQALRLKPDYPEARLNLAGALNDLGRHAESADAYREAIRFRPDDARAHKNLGITLAKQNKLDEAIACYREALRLRPDYADAHNDLGIALAKQLRFADAAESYRRALAHRPDYAEAHNNLGNTLRNLGRFDESIASYNRAVELKPQYADAYNNRGIAFAELGRFDEAIASYSSCLELRPGHADAHLNRALTRLRQGDFARGWAEYEWRLRKRGVPPKPPTQPAWNGFPPAGLRIRLVAEQGLGDSIHFIRYAALLKQRGATVHFEAQERLIKLLARTPGIDTIYPLGQDPPEYDVYAPLMSIPGLMGTGLDAIPADVPYVHPDPDLVDYWRRELAAYPEFKVGINWQGNREYSGDFHRSMPLSHFAALARVPGVRLFSLQKNAGYDQLKELGDAFPVVDLGPRLDEASGPFMDTAAVMKNLDLFITSDTAVAHLAGALGVPVWVALSSAPGWQWMAGREDSPWYPTMRLFRQSRLGDWPSVFERIAAELVRAVPAALRARSIAVRISPGELAERIANLQVEVECAVDSTARQAMRGELARLEAMWAGSTVPSTGLASLVDELQATARALRTSEEVLREAERAGDFGPRFVVSAREVSAARARLVDLRGRVDDLVLDPDKRPGSVPA